MALTTTNSGALQQTPQVRAPLLDAIGHVEGGPQALDCAGGKEQGDEGTERQKPEPTPPHHRHDLRSDSLGDLLGHQFEQLSDGLFGERLASEIPGEGT